MFKEGNKVQETKIILFDFLFFSENEIPYERHYDRGLYMFYPIFEVQFFVSRMFFQIILSLSLYMVSLLDWVMIAHGQ